MKTLLLILALLGLHHIGKAQYGISSQYVSSKAKYIPVSDLSADEINNITSGYHLGLNYWLRLKNVRLEFFPEIGYTHLDSRSDESQADFMIDQWSLTIPASFYLLDFKGDCHCPTFSKQNDLVKKGFFVQLITALEFERAKFESLLPDAWQQNVKGGIGLGLDIGASDFLTVTPIVQYLMPLYSNRQEQHPATFDSWRLGLRATFRPDYH